jgi:hypothetical protein
VRVCVYVCVCAPSSSRPQQQRLSRHSYDGAVRMVWMEHFDCHPSCVRTVCFFGIWEGGGARVSGAVSFLYVLALLHVWEHSKVLRCLDYKVLVIAESRGVAKGILCGLRL